MKDIQSLLSKRYAQKKKVFHIDDKTIFHILSKIIKQEYGNQGVENIIPEYYEKNTIFVSFGQSLWAQEVWLNRGKLIDKVNNEIGSKVLYNIKVKH